MCMVLPLCPINCGCNTVQSGMALLINAITIYFYIISKYIVEISMDPSINKYIQKDPL